MRQTYNRRKDERESYIYFSDTPFGDLIASNIQTSTILYVYAVHTVCSTCWNRSFTIRKSLSQHWKKAAQLVQNMSMQKWCTHLSAEKRNKMRRPSKPYMNWVSLASPNRYLGFSSCPKRAFGKGYPIYDYYIYNNDNTEITRRLLAGVANKK